jgi:hypothetical protein
MTDTDHKAILVEFKPQLMNSINHKAIQWSGAFLLVVIHVHELNFQLQPLATRKISVAFYVESYK